MRRIQTREEIEKKRKINTAILSTIMLFLLVLSTLGFAFLSGPSSSSNQNTGNSQQNTSGTDKINFVYQNTIFNLISTYNSIANISINTTTSPESYSGRILYIDSNNTGIFQEIASTIGRFSSRVQPACYTTCEQNLPEKNCTDNLIIWRESQENKVFQNENCVFIEGDMRAVDAFIYKLFNKNTY